MALYLGQPGSLIPLHRVNAVEVTANRPSSHRTTLGGRRRVQRGPKSRREWSLRTNQFLSPAESAGLLSLIEGGTPPWVFVEPYAQVTNLLSPEQSVLATGTWAGAGVVEGGSAVATDGTVALRTVSHPDAGTVSFGYRSGLADFTPVVPGEKVTGSVYVRGGGQFYLRFVDWAGADVQWNNAFYAHSGLSRVDVTRVAPAGAAYARISVDGAYQGALPAITWTPEVADWSVGRGCNRVVVEGLSEAVQMAGRTPGRQYSSLSLTVREVG